MDRLIGRNPGKRPVTMTGKGTTLNGDAPDTQRQCETGAAEKDGA